MYFLLRKKTVLIEITSGNLGIALASIAAVKGYKFIAVMPDSYSVERRILLLALGAELHITPPITELGGLQKKVEEIMKVTPNCYFLSQCENPSNPKVCFFVLVCDLHEKIFSSLYNYISLSSFGSITDLTWYQS